MSRVEEWLALLRTPGLGPERAELLLEHFGSPGAALAAGTEARRAAGLPPGPSRDLETPDQAGIDADLAWLAGSPDHHLLPRDDPRYPERLRATDQPPLCLFVNGDPEVLDWPQLAVVGSRNPTPDGERTAQAFAGHLGGRGLAITSGLALGVDAAAHRGALDADAPTIAVTATGADRVYPARNRELAHAIAGGGAVVTEFPVGTPARAGHFPRRNRIISGLSTGVLVVEASVRSGALITARHALDQGREVFAIPGSIHNPLARGCHRLIRDGAAKLVEQADDILAELAGQLARPAETARTAPADAPETAPEPGLDAEHEQVLAAVGYDPVPLETVLARTGLTADTVSSILLLLEVSGRIEAMPGGRYARAGRD
ncbi:MAG: DNA-processing protein DprA [Ectothiorhodospiraceae bacterium]